MWEGEKAGITGPPYLSQDVRAYLLGWSEGTPNPRPIDPQWSFSVSHRASSVLPRSWTMRSAMAATP